jgi:thymidylate kinase
VPAVLGALFEALEREHLRWSLLRPVASVASAEGDVDVLLEPAALGQADRLLARLGYVLMPYPGPDVHGVAYDAEAGRFVWVHVQGTLRLAGATFEAEEVLAGALEEGGFRRAGDDHLLWILLLRALVEKGELAERHREAVAALARGWQGGPAALVALARGRGVDPERAVARAASEDWPGLLALSVRRPAPKRAHVRRAARALRRLRGGRGISVAVIGPDGAGKSTLVEALARDLPLDTLVQYMGLTGGRMPQADALRVPGVVLAARLGILWARYARGHRHMARGGIVVFERYTLDGHVPAGIPLGRAGRLSRRVQRHACPLPDLVLLLDASGRTLHARSGEYDDTVLERWRSAFAELEGRPQLVKVDAERPPDDVRREALALVWRRYGELRGREAGPR